MCIEVTRADFNTLDSLNKPMIENRCMIDCGANHNLFSRKEDFVSLEEAKRVKLTGIHGMKEEKLHFGNLKKNKWKLKRGVWFPRCKSRAILSVDKLRRAGNGCLLYTSPSPRDS